MIVRGFTILRTHEVKDDLETTVDTFAGCLFTTLTVPVVRTRCDQFLETVQGHTVVMVGATEPTCSACCDAITREAVRAAASAE